MPESLHFSFSSVSCVPTNLFRPDQIIWPSTATQAIADRALAGVRAVESVWGEGSSSVSAHLARVINTGRLVEALDRNGVGVSSWDMPDVFPTVQLAKTLGHSLGAGDGLWKNHVGWWLQNVESLEAYERKVAEALRLSKEESRPLVRANANEWTEFGTGEELLWQLMTSPSQPRLAVEIDADRQTPAEYVAFVEALGKNTTVPVGFDVDVAHLARSRHLHRDDGTIPVPEAFLAGLLADPRLCNQVYALSLSQFEEGQVEAHTAFWQGQINLLTVAGLLGLAQYRGMEDLPVLVGEMHPTDFDQVISAEGLTQFAFLRNSFETKVD